MQGHYEETTQPSPFANVSVNNPNRYTNANRVNRIGTLSISPTRAEADANKPSAIFDLKPVLSISISSNGSITTQSLVDTPMEASAEQPVAVSNFDAGDSSSIAQSQDTAATTTAATPYLTNGAYSVAIQPSNQEMATLFNLSFNHGFN